MDYIQVSTNIGLTLTVLGGVFIMLKSMRDDMHRIEDKWTHHLSTMDDKWVHLYKEWADLQKQIYEIKLFLSKNDKKK